MPAKTSKILVAEDDISQRFLLKSVLTSESFNVIEAEDGVEAWRILTSDPDINIVITDLDMPLMDGYELIRRIREDETGYRYIIVLSATSGKGAVTKALASGADDYLSKPVMPLELKLRIQGGQRLLRLQSQEELIFALASLAEYRSNETGNHLSRVELFVKLIANDIAINRPEYGLTTLMAAEIARTSPLHDIGKVAVPDSILHKPGHLSKEEFDIIKTHAAVGGELLRNLYRKTGQRYLQFASDIAMYHHEKWDGSGYPAGLSATAIPIAARIMAVADVYDALTSDRCYKKAMSHADARKIMEDGAGSHFDPDLTGLFFRHEDLILTIKERLY